MEQINVDVRGY